MGHPESELTVVFAAGPNRFEAMSLWLARSVDAVSNHALMVFVPKREEAAMSEGALTELRELSTELVIGEVTIPEYGQSAKLDAFVAAKDRFEPPYLLLDTDTLLLNPIQSPLDGRDVVAKPVDMGAQFWGSDAARAKWEELYTTHGFELPDAVVKTTVDEREIVPYFNAGVVGTNVRSFPDRWLNLTKSVYEKIDHAFFSDQVALAIAMYDKNYGLLNENDNYPGTLRLLFPTDIRVLHYHNLDVLLRVRNQTHRQVFSQIGLEDRLRSYSKFDKIYSVGESLRRISKYRILRQIKHDVRDAVHKNN